MVEWLQERGNDALLRRFHIPAGILHEPGGAQKGDGNVNGAQALFRYLRIVQQIEFRHLGTDRGQEDHLARLRGGNGGLNRLDCFVCERKARLGVEVGRRHKEHAVGAGKRLRQTNRIRDRRDRDLAALLDPRPALSRVTDDSPNRQAGRQKSVCNNTSNLPSDSCDGVHNASPQTSSYRESPSSFLANRNVASSPSLAY